MLGSLSIETRTGSAKLGKITGILSDGTAVTTGQSITDVSVALADFSNLQTQISAQDAVNTGLFATLFTLVGTLVGDLTALTNRVALLEQDAVTFKFDGGTAVPVKQIQLRTGDFPGTAYYPQSGILMASITTPPLQNPY